MNEAIDSQEETAEVLRRITAALADRVLGQSAAIERLLATYLAGGHALLEGVPGIGKSLLARTFAAVLGLGFRRVQFTPDLMPSDILGTNVYDQEAGGFHLVRGPIFTQVLMADEINRTPPKTQSALLEAMQERQVTIDGEGLALDPGFFVVATQNPIEFEGTYPLPEAQLDRFLTRIRMQPPEHPDEVELYRRAVDGRLAGWGFGPGPVPSPVLRPEEAAALRQGVSRVHVADELLDYLARLAAATRASEQVELGISPRGALALLATARATALLAERNYLVPDDFKSCLEACWGHRLLLTAEAELEGHGVPAVLERIAATVEVPR